jgi:general secretion pathway protein D
MISIIRDNKGWRRGFLSWKKGILLAAATAVLASVWFAHGDMKAYAQEKDKNIQLNFKDTPIETILGYLSETAGVVVISETSLSGRLTVISKKNLNLDEAVSLINTVLKERGYTAVRSGNNLKVTTLAAAKKMSIPIVTGNDPNSITPSDDVITCIIPVSFAKAATLKDNIKSFLSDTADYSSNADTNTLIITDTANNIRRVLEIIKAIDTHVAAVAIVRVFHLNYASAEDTATLLNNVFKSSTSSSSSSSNLFQQMGGRFANAMQGGGMQGQQGQQGQTQGQQQQTSQDGQSSASVSVTAKGDDRTNSVVVSAPAETMAVVEKVIKDLDADSSVGQALFVYKLKNGQASNLVTVLNNLFTSISSTSSTSSSSKTSSGATGQQSGPMSPGGQTSSQSSSSSSSSTGLVGNVYVKADTDTNALVFLTSPSNYEKIKKMVEDLDKPVPQVLIKALIAEVTEDASRDLGTEFSFLNDWKDKKISEIQVGSAFNVPDTLATLSSGGWATVVGEKFSVKIKALAETGKMNVLSKPYILATNNQKATMTIGSSVPYITDTRTTDTGQTINTIQYEDIGIILTVTPVINDEGLVTMDITQEISSISDTTIAISSSLNATVFNKRTSTNRVIARDGQTVVIGGLMKDSKTKNSTKIPLLGSIPILGGLFREDTKKDEKTELLIFITPTVAATDKDLERISNEKKKENPAIDKVYSKKDLGFEEQSEKTQNDTSSK